MAKVNKISLSQPNPKTEGTPESRPPTKAGRAEGHVIIRYCSTHHDAAHLLCGNISPSTGVYF